MNITLIKDNLVLYGESGYRVVPKDKIVEYAKSGKITFKEAHALNHFLWKLSNDKFMRDIEMLSNGTYKKENE